MVDIYFFEEDFDENTESALGQNYCCDNEEDGLSPLSKLVKYAGSENVSDRQTAARTVLDTLRQVSDSDEEVTSLFEIVGRLSLDHVPAVLVERMEQVPHIAKFCQELPESLQCVVSLSSSSESILAPVSARY